MSTADLGLYAMARHRTLDALCDLIASRHLRGEQTVLLAGGTDWMVEREMSPPMAPGGAVPLVVDISQMDELRGIRRDGDRLRIGAAATFLEIRRDPEVTSRCPLLERMARDVGAIQIQARGTLGGNLATASPAADGVAALAALDATVVVRSVRGERSIPFAELQTAYKRSSRAPDEVIVAIELTLPAAGSAFLWRKVGARRAQAISKIALAAVAEIGGGRCTRFGLGMASVGPVTARMPATRALAMERPLAAIGASDVDLAVAEDVKPIDDVRSTGEYRLHCARAATRQFFRELGAPC
jgi:xanthine dehydrogenase small subunit